MLYKASTFGGGEAQFELIVSRRRLFLIHHLAMRISLINTHASNLTKAHVHHLHHYSSLRGNTGDEHLRCFCLRYRSHSFIGSPLIAVDRGAELYSCLRNGRDFL
jgi:hypothetical protein